MRTDLATAAEHSGPRAIQAIEPGSGLENIEISIFIKNKKIDWSIKHE
jgi:hypothetical protein